MKSKLKKITKQSLVAACFFILMAGCYSKQAETPIFGWKCKEEPCRELWWECFEACEKEIINKSKNDFMCLEYKNICNNHYIDLCEDYKGIWLSKLNKEY